MRRHSPHRQKASPRGQMAGFLALPPELRNEIYKHRVLSRTEADNRKSHSVTDFRVRHGLLMPLILADKGIGNEMLPIFFGDNLLHLTDKQAECTRRSKRFFANGNALEGNDRRIIVPYSTPECVQCPDHRAHRVVGGRTIELPPHKWRHLFKHVKLTLHAPDRPPSLLLPTGRPCLDHRRLSVEDRHMWHQQNVDWLYPVRKLATFGFSKLHSLEIEIQPSEPRPTVEQLKTLEIWVKEKIAGMQIDAAEICVSVKCRGKPARTFMWL